MTNVWPIIAKSRLRVLLIVLLAACLLPTAAPCNAATPQVLIIHSYHPGFSWTDRINSGMTETLHIAAPDADLHIEYLDAKRYQPERILPAFEELLFRKYQETPLDVIIVSDDAAFEAILSSRDSLFPGVPLVFCGVNAFEERMIEGFADVTGVIEDFDLAGTLDLALALHPDVKHLAAVSDSTASGRLNLERFRQIKPLYEDRFTSIVELAELSEQELRQELSRLDQTDTVILLLSFYRDRNGTAFSVPEMTKLIAESARVPVYSAWDFVLGNKVVGGRVVSGQEQGRVAAELAVRILDGEPAGAIPIVRVSPNLSLFDDRELSFFGIDRDKLPDDSVILNQPPSSLQHYIWLIAGLVLFAIVETLLVLALLEKSRRYKVAEEELRRSKERFSLAMQAATDGIFDWNLETNDIYYSPAWKQMLGYREDELENRFSDWERLTAPEDVTHSWQVMQEHLEGKRERFEAELKMRHKDGHWVDVLARASAVFDGAGKPVRVVGTHVDITARKQAEKALRESEERFRTLYLSTPAMMHSIDTQGRLIAVSRRWLEKMEYAADEVLGRKSIDFLTEASRRYATEVALPRFFQTGIADNTEYQMVTKSGRILDTLMSAISERDEHGTVIRSMAVIEDITERKRAEDALRKSEANLREAQAIARVGRWELDLISGNLFWSEGIFTLCEINREDFTPSYDAFLALVHPDDRAAVDHAYLSSVENKTPYEIEHRLLMPDGRIKWVTEIGRTEYGADGTPVRSIGTVQDISERKQAEKALIDRETLFRGMFEEHSAVMLLIDPKTGMIVKANRAAASYYGYPPEAMLQMQVQQLNASLPAETAKNMRRALQKQKNLFAFKHVLADGQIRDVEVHSTPITIQDRPLLFSIIHDITERKRAEAALRKSEEKYRYMFENIQDAVYAVTLDGEILDVSPSIGELSRGQLTREELIGKSVYDFYPDAETRKTFLETLQKTGRVNDYEITLKNRDGSTTVCSISAKMQYDSQGQPVKIIGNIHDISDRAALEKRLLQSQKMESVGRLAGGVAHDFNNMLGVILGYTEISLEQVSQTDPIHRFLLEIQHAAQRSADLTAQLLAFARRQTATPRVLELNKTVQGVLTMLRRLIGENIDLVWRPGQSLAPVKMDPSQVDQILANLCVNARDAISGTGTITIETANVTIAERAAAADNLETLPGHYVLLTISDSGCGMDSETLSHLFEPFFTTKRVGEGTGLGLATVYGIVKQNNGFIDVQSDVGNGTTFKIFLPRSDSTHDQPTDRSDATAILPGVEAVLLVEDEPMILEMTTTMLEKLGYQVFAHASPQAAINFAEHHTGDLHLLVTDVIMPEMNGRDLADKLHPYYPNLKCLFMSGYTADVIAHHGVLDEHVCFIQKPFTRSDLSKKIRDALGRGSV